MSRNAAGVYTLPAGNPVVTNTTITTLWGNGTMTDLGAEITNSLDRSGRGKMLVPFQMLDGSVAAPAYTFTLEPTTGLYRAGAGQLGFSILGVLRMLLDSTGLSFNGPVTMTGNVAITGDLSVSGAFTWAGLANYALLASPAFTGIPTAPTAAAGTNTTQIATTAFVQQAAFNTALPVQSVATVDQVVTSDGTNASWQDIPQSLYVINNFGAFL